MTMTTRISSCDVCGDQVAHDDLVTVRSECSARPIWICPSCAVDYVECDECHKRVDRSVAVARDGDDTAPWLCFYCVRGCDECYCLVAVDGVIASINDDTAPRYCDRCVRYCDECDERIDNHDDATARDGDGKAPWLCDECARPCDECRSVVYIDDEHIVVEDRPWLCDECLQCDECGDRTPFEDRIARDGDDRAPWLCSECAVPCDRCGRAIFRDDARVGERGTWICDECAVPCDQCGVMVVIDADMSGGPGYPAPWLCEECSEECDQCGVQIPREDSIGLCAECEAAEVEADEADVPVGTA